MINEWIIALDKDGKKVEGNGMTRYISNNESYIIIDCSPGCIRGRDLIHVRVCDVIKIKKNW